jgi:uncharacterized protein YfdQ (DUF2303 family)
VIPNDHRTEADAILEWADAHREDVPERFTDPGDDTVRHLFVPQGHVLQTLDPERYAYRPRRASGLIDVHDAASFVNAVEHRQGTDRVVVYGDVKNRGLCAVLNDDQADGTAGWRDHRVVLRLEATPEWQMWQKGQGLVSQAKFAEHIQDGEPEIVEPTAAVMLEIAETFSAKSDVTFKSGVRNQSGQRTFVYDEQTTTGAGKAGTIDVPETFVVGVAPFVGSPKYRVKARLVYRITRGDFLIGYQLVRSDDVLRDAFQQVMAEVSDGLPEGTLMLMGPAPATRIPA